MPGIYAVDSHMNDRPGVMALLILHLQALHQFCIAGRHGNAVHQRRNSVAADLLNIADSGPVYQLSVSLLQAFADRMGRCALRERGILQKPFLFHLIVVNRIHLEDSLRQGTGLVKYDTVRLRQRLQIIGTFHQHARIACSPDPGKKAQRDTDHQRARTTDHEERQRPVNPVSKIRRKSQKGHPHQRRQKRKGKRAVADQGSINSCEFRDKVLGL